ncbi:CBS domain-containing protein [Streptomyces sp. BR123]|uniref:CBS domain-containing protein n=1 Tax=Streptomyces sp. BR123 TaxID=2749828 RepID=UPI00211B145C|nr:CBS domain-containing protein [Streptomyces sp. BR123]
MKHLRTVDDVTTRAVASVDRRAPCTGIVDTMRRRRIRSAVTVPRDAAIGGAARPMARGHLKRLPVVVDDGRLVGIVGRGDLLKICLRPDAAQPDEAIPA